MIEENKGFENERVPELEERGAIEESGEGKEESRSDGFENTIYDWARCLVSAVVGVVLLFVFLFRMIGVSGGSMQNTLYTGDRLIMLNSVFCNYEQGDIVVINAYNSALSSTIIKRIVAVGGQTVDIDFEQGIVYVDGVAMDEPYVRELTYTNEGVSFPLTLAEDEVFVMGDNRNRSTDSRSLQLGPVKESYIQGEAVFLLIPGKDPDSEKMDWSRFGFLN